MKKMLLGASFFLLLLILTACGSNGFSGSTNYAEPNVSVQEIPDEPTKDELMEQINNSNLNDIEPVIANHFHLLDSVEGEGGVANIYATNQFEVEELATLIADVIKPEEKSDLIDNQQILIYPNHFATFKASEEDPNTTLIEIAPKQFVRNNYAPNFLTTYFALRLLDNVLDVDDWAKNRRAKCSNGNCYGGYTTRSSNQGGFNTNRGMSSVRGGGPSAGK